MLALTAGAAVAQPSNTAVYVSAAQVAALSARTKDGIATAPVPTGPGVVLLSAHRDADGQVEVHDRLADELIVQAGQATELIGGSVAGNKQTAPGEWRGGKIAGARSYPLGPGDVLWIPPGTPHQTLVPKGGDIRYLAFKFAAPAPSK
ncbi:AraC family ligand binding domain-containing protein [Phenylobacterium sp.]|uniref:AraC family ligand binding domain-containing protein n=1 Tax=Phenylobacterium sp. TaxID=1871053 RepID=UPI002F3FFE06